MPSFSGYGAGKGAWTKRRYLPDGTVVDGPRPPPEAKRGPSHHTRFIPFVGHAPTPEDAQALGLKRTKTKGTVFETERQLDSYIAREKDHGREVGWKDW